MIFDCHIHTIFSTDSTMRIEDAIKKAKFQDIGITITEHIDVNYPEANAYNFNIEEYFATYEKYRNEEVLLGMEMGMRRSCLKENIALNSNYKFDYVIGSLHLVNGIDIYEKKYYENRSKIEAYEEYFNYMLACVREHNFIDSLGHIDYIARYASFTDPEIYYIDFKDYIDEILKVIIKNNVVIEINTRRLKQENSIKNLIEIYKRYSELGGKYVTLGSDSHKCDDIGKNFKVGTEIAEICELKIVHFKERKMILSK